MRLAGYWFFFLLAFWACDVCNDCGPVVNDPFVNISFYYSSDSSSAEIVIDSINGLSAVNISEELYGDTAQVFRLPLNFNTDSSFFDITYSNYPDEEDSLRAQQSHNDQLALTYQLQLINNDNFIKYEADSLQVVYFTFDSVANQNNNPEKLSNAVTLQVYF